jgi:hypothetical protein
LEREKVKDGHGFCLRWNINDFLHYTSEAKIIHANLEDEGDSKLTLLGLI